MKILISDGDFFFEGYVTGISPARGISDTTTNIQKPSFIQRGELRHGTNTIYIYRERDIDIDIIYLYLYICIYINMYIFIYK